MYRAIYFIGCSNCSFYDIQSKSTCIFITLISFLVIILVLYSLFSASVKQTRTVNTAYLHFLPNISQLVTDIQIIESNRTSQSTTSYQLLSLHNTSVAVDNAQEFVTTFRQEQRSSNFTKATTVNSSYASFAIIPSQWENGSFETNALHQNSNEAQEHQEETYQLQRKTTDLPKATRLSLNSVLFSNVLVSPSEGDRTIKLLQAHSEINSIIANKTYMFEITTANRTDLFETMTNRTDLYEATANRTDSFKATANETAFYETTANGTDLHEITANNTDLYEITTNKTDLYETTDNRTNLSETTDNNTDLYEIITNKTDLYQTTASKTELYETTNNEADLFEIPTNKTDLYELTTNKTALYETTKINQVDLYETATIFSQSDIDLSLETTIYQTDLYKIATDMLQTATDSYKTTVLPQGESDSYKTEVHEANLYETVTSLYRDVTDLYETTAYGNDEFYETKTVSSQDEIEVYGAAAYNTQPYKTTTTSFQKKTDLFETAVHNTKFYKTTTSSSHQDETDLHKLRGILFVEVRGRLGNQMFEYASAYCVARRNSLRFIYNHDDLGQIFELTPEKPQNRLLKFPRLKMRKFKERLACTYDNRTENILEAIETDDSWQTKKHRMAPHVIMKGYYQSWRYFDDCKKDIKRAFSFKPHIQKVAYKFLRDSIRASFVDLLEKESDNEDENEMAMMTTILNIKPSTIKVTTVGIHIRRGDMLRHVNFGYTLAPGSYIENAMKYFEDKYSLLGEQNHVMFVVCSQDFDWFSQNVKNYRSPVVLSRNHLPEEDLAILASCDHIITTLGTFSWWAGWLSGGNVIYYKNYPSPNSQLDKVTNKEDFFPSDWIALE